MPQVTKPVAAQPANTLAYEISLWPQRKIAAISLSFDDGGEDHFTVAAAEMTRRGMRGTFFLPTGWIGQKNRATWDQVRKAAADGHEIASHTISHSLQEGDEALWGSRDRIDKEVPGQKCATIAFQHPDILKYYIAARQPGKHYIYTHHPVNLAKVEDYIMDRASLEDWRKLAEELIAKRGWCVVTLHGPGQQWAEKLDVFKARREQIHVAPFGQMMRYVREARACRLERLAEDDKSMRLKLTDDLPDEVFDQPLTLLVPLPAGWTRAQVTQNGKAVWQAIEDGRAVFEATPDRGDIVLNRLK